MTPDHPDDAELFRSILIEDAKSRAGDHPDLDTLVEYLTDALDTEVDDRIRDHLAACRPCATALLDLQPLVTPEAAQEGVADLQLESAWRDLEGRLPAPTPHRTRAAPTWPRALAASLVLAIVGLSVWVIRLQDTEVRLERRLAELSRPQANLPVFYLDGVTRGEGMDAIELEVPAEANFFALIVASGEIVPEGVYRVRFLDAEGAEVFRSDELRMSDSGGLRLGLPRPALPEGEYLIRLETAGVGESRAIEEYRRRISYPNGT